MDKHIEEKNLYWLDFLKNLDETKLVLKKIESDHGDTALAVLKKDKNPK